VGRTLGDAYHCVRNTAEGGSRPLEVQSTLAAVLMDTCGH
jgi:hypothetical protein